MTGLTYSIGTFPPPRPSPARGEGELREGPIVANRKISPSSVTWGGKVSEGSIVANHLISPSPPSGLNIASHHKFPPPAEGEGQGGGDERVRTRTRKHP